MLAAVMRVAGHETSGGASRKRSCWETRIKVWRPGSTASEGSTSAFANSPLAAADRHPSYGLVLEILIQTGDLVPATIPPRARSTTMARPPDSLRIACYRSGNVSRKEAR